MFQRIVLLSFILLNMSQAHVFETVLRTKDDVWVSSVGNVIPGEKKISSWTGANVQINGTAAQALTELLATTVTPWEGPVREDGTRMVRYVGKSIFCIKDSPPGSYECWMGVTAEGDVKARLFIEPRGGGSVHN